MNLSFVSFHSSSTNSSVSSSSSTTFGFPLSSMRSTLFGSLCNKLHFNGFKDITLQFAATCPYLPHFIHLFESHTSTSSFFFLPHQSCLCNFLQSVSTVHITGNIQSGNIPCEVLLTASFAPIVWALRC